MEMKKISQFDQLIQKDSITKSGGVGNATGLNKSSGPSFKDALDKIQNQANLANVGGAAQVKNLDQVKFSNHAVERMRTRGINYSPTDLDRISQAVDKAAAKGSKDSLILMDDSALIVSVKNKTIVTVMDKAQLKENVFTNIDSTIVM